MLFQALGMNPAIVTASVLALAVIFFAAAREIAERKEDIKSARACLGGALGCIAGLLIIASRVSAPPV